MSRQQSNIYNLKTFSKYFRNWTIGLNGVENLKGKVQFVPDLTEIKRDKNHLSLSQSSGVAFVPQRKQAMRLMRICRLLVLTF